MAERARTDRDALDLKGQRALASVLAGIGGRKVVVRVGRYEIGEPLGQGACGEVFAAHDPELQREVAIKVVLPRHDRVDPHAEARLLREAKALARLGHPNVVQIYDVGADVIGVGTGGGARRGVFIVMERIDGCTLLQWLRARDRGRDAILGAFIDAARGLAAAHSVGVVHRDFKPGNAMVAADGRVVVLDFGLATAFEDVAEPITERAVASSSSDDLQAVLTKTGYVLGTPRYMAPEQHAAEPVTPASDQYAWCLALWEALAGAPPFRESTMAALARAKQTLKLPRARGIASDVRAVLVRGLQPDPAQRFASMNDLLDALPRTRVRHRWRRLGVIVGGLGVGAAAIAWMPRPRPPTCDAAGPSVATIDAVDDALAVEIDGPSPRMRAKIYTRMHRFVDRYDTARTAMCEAWPTLDRAMAQARARCLTRASDRFAEAIATIEAGPTAAARFGKLYALASPTRCEQPDADQAFVPRPDRRPEDDEIAGRVERAMLSGYAMRPPDVGDVVERALALAEVESDHALATHGYLLRAFGAGSGQRNPEAAEALSLASWHAEGSGDDLLAAEIHPVVLRMFIVNGAPPEEIDALLRVALERAETIEDAPWLHAELDRVQAEILRARGDEHGALRKYLDDARKLEAQPRTRATDPSMLPSMYVSIASIHMQAGRWWAARWAFDRALTTITGDDVHASTQIANLSAGHTDVALRTGDLEAAERTALLAWSSPGADARHPTQRAISRGWYGFVIGVGGEVERGREHLQAAIADLSADPSASFTATKPMGELAELYLLTGQPEQAVTILRERRQRLAGGRTAQPDPASEALFALALARSGALDEAQATIARIEQVAARGAGPFSDRSIDGLARARAELAIARADWAAARTALDEVLCDPQLHDGTPLSRGDLGESYWLLARVFAALGDRDQAAALVRVADLAWQGADPARRERRPALAAWLSDVDR